MYNIKFLCLLIYSLINIASFMYSTCASLKHLNISVFIYIYMLQIEI